MHCTHINGIAKVQRSSWYTGTFSHHFHKNGKTYRNTDSMFLSEMKQPHMGLLQFFFWYTGKLIFRSIFLGKACWTASSNCAHTAMHWYMLYCMWSCIQAWDSSATHSAIGRRRHLVVRVGKSIAATFVVLWTAAIMHFSSGGYYF